MKVELRAKTIDHFKPVGSDLMQKNNPSTFIDDPRKGGAEDDEPAT